jgi:hypothetical protein
LAIVLRPFGLSYELALPLIVIMDPVVAMVRGVLNVAGPCRLAEDAARPEAELVAAHPAAVGINLQHALAGMPVPLHPGAQRYYREKGLIK